MKQKDSRLGLRLDSFIILSYLIIYIYVLIQDIYHSPNIAAAQKYGFVLVDFSLWIHGF